MVAFVLISLLAGMCIGAIWRVLMLIHVLGCFLVVAIMLDIIVRVPLLSTLTHVVVSVVCIQTGYLVGLLLRDGLERVVASVRHP